MADTKFFAMIEDERRGPFTLQELVDFGVHPDTYVWCKGMDDWKQAKEVGEICRYFRLRITNLMHPPTPETPNTQTIRQLSEQEAWDALPPAIRHQVEKSGTTPGPILKNEPDYTIRPRSWLVESILVTLFCFPLTGFISIYFAINTQKLWKAGKREEAYETSRKAKMWGGITFFMGFILIAFFSHKVGIR